MLTLPLGANFVQFLVIFIFFKVPTVNTQAKNKRQNHRKLSKIKKYASAS